MVETEEIPSPRRRALERVAWDLHSHYEGVFGQETIEALVVDSYLKLAATATVSTWLVLGAERLAMDRLRALVYSEDHSPKRLPSVLFLCTHNAGRSQMALGWFAKLSDGRAVGWSGGSEPGGEINRVAVEAMAEVGVDISGGFPKPWTNEVLAAADVVVTMGCGDACPLVPGKHYEDWKVADPAGQSLSVVRPIRDDLERRVRILLHQVGVETV